MFLVFVQSAHMVCIVVFTKLIRGKTTRSAPVPALQGLLAMVVFAYRSASV
ncbi:hypothetical protein [Roseinatronobacter alkalisoli]|uniref:Uncharacterized protein n=1 Tax=Roseinatronobacter alkalisoli TaxID=3028235 RepID=A0ABT5T838_9RHOB|nr:hypothetical protein [Roseinatronobacter sp. HJB301]MDD7970352.1 hypothetical protein [Roseinatronobacter sp. HJB301]